MFESLTFHSLYKPSTAEIGHIPQLKYILAAVGDTHQVTTFRKHLKTC